MFTKQELNVLHSALESWSGPYRYQLENLEPDKRTRQNAAQGEAIACRNRLADRFAEILQDYQEMRESHLP